MRKEVRWLITGLVGWVLTCELVVWLTIRWFSFEPTFPYYHELLAHYGSRLVTTWLNFDGVHYLTIVLKGYVGTGLIQAFFPLYPMLIRALRFTIFNPMWLGLLLSWGSFAGSIVWLWKLLDFERLNHKKRVFWILISFPTAYFLLSYYSESLFLFLSIGAYYLARKTRWGWAGLFGLLTGLARLQGVLVSILLIYEAYRQERLKRILFWTLMPVLGLLVYMVYLWSTFGDPLLFLTVQNAFGAQRSSGVLIPILTPLFRYLKILVTVPVWSHAFFISIQEFILTVGGFYLTWRLWLRKEYGYSLYAFSSLLLPTLTGTLSSMPRYILVIFPLFIELSRIKTRWYTVILIGFMIVQVINLALFTQGLWVA